MTGQDQVLPTAPVLHPVRDRLLVRRAVTYVFALGLCRELREVVAPSADRGFYLGRLAVLPEGCPALASERCTTEIMKEIIGRGL